MPTVTAIGLISGTSMDGVDAALLSIEGCGLETEISLEGACTLPYLPELRLLLMRACSPETSSVDDICKLNFLVGEHFAAAAHELMRRCSRDIEEVDVIGSHGQTIYHAPSSSGPRRGFEQSANAGSLPPEQRGAFVSPAKFSLGKVNSTLQIGEPAVIASRTGLTTVADFRVADMAEGGTGAPLSPYAHLLLFKGLRLPLAVQNIGGISNLTVVPADGNPSSMLAFDTGPGNMVVDALVADITDGKMSFDEDGSISSAGRVNEALLHYLMKHPYFETPPPKTSGREMFGEDYVTELIQKGRESGVEGEDLVATAVALTAHTIAQSYRRYVFPRHPVREVLLCGGGARNPTMKAMLEELMHPVRIGMTDDYGIPSDYLEAMTFALLASEALHGQAANLPSVTGARRPVILGKIVPGDNFHSLLQMVHHMPGS